MIYYKIWYSLVKEAEEATAPHSRHDDFISLEFSYDILVTMHFMFYTLML